MAENPQIPVVNSVRVLADLVRTDLLRNGLVPSGDNVIYGDGDPGKRTTPNQSPRPPVVWFRLDKPFAIDVAQTGEPAPVAMDVEVDEQNVWAPSIGVEKIRAIVTMHALVPEEVSSAQIRRGRTAAKNAEEAGAQLRQRVYAAIYRYCVGSFRVLAAENLDPPNSEFAYGSASRMVVELSIHIPDDANPYNDAEAQGTQEQDGEVVADLSDP